MMADNKNKTNQLPARKMQKRVKLKDDGRALIYYTFEEEPQLTAQDPDPKENEGK